MDLSLIHIYFKELGGKSDIIACSDEELFEINGVSHSSFGVPIQIVPLKRIC